MDGDEDSKVKGGGGGKGGLLLSEREETFFDLLSTIKRSWREATNSSVQTSH